MDIKTVVLKLIPGIQTYRFKLQIVLKKVFVFLRYLPGNSTIIGPPRGIYLNSTDYNSEYKNLSFPIQELVLKEEVSFSRELPRTNSPLITNKFQSCLDSKIIRKVGFVLPEARYISGFGGTVVTNDDKIFIPCSPLRNEWYPERHQSLYKIRLPRIESVDKIVLINTNCAEHNYHHWISDHLPRFYWLREMGLDLSDYILVSNIGNHEYQRYSYKVLQDNGFTFREIITRKIEHISCKEIVIPPYSTLALNGDTTSYDPVQSSFLKEMFLKGLSTKRIGARVFISRRRSLRTSPQEVELVEKLNKHGFKEVFAEDYNISEQATIFNSADIIVGFHGAGLTNIHFCRPNTTIVEIFSPDFIVTDFWRIATKQNLRYLAYCEDSEKSNIEVWPGRVSCVCPSPPW